MGDTLCSLPYGSKVSSDKIFMNLGNPLCITKILASKLLVLYRYSPAIYMNISRQCHRASYRHKMENLPVAASSIFNVHDSVSIPSDPFYASVFVVGYPTKDLR